MTSDLEVRVVSTTIHGRMLVHHPLAPPPRAMLVGFHGYLENADIQMERMLAIPGALDFTVVSVQGLHRVYKGRTDEVVASWMTREDREAAIADNIAYVDATMATLFRDPRVPLVYAGFSQGTSMAFRAALRSRSRAKAVIAVGGDVPPELLRDASAQFPAVLLLRGEQDETYPQSKLDADFVALSARRVKVSTATFEGAHEWTAEASFAAGQFITDICPRDRP